MLSLLRMIHSRKIEEHKIEANRVANMRGDGYTLHYLDQDLGLDIDIQTPKH